QIHLPKRDDKARIDRQQKQEIELAAANEFRKIRAVDQKKGLKNLLNEMAGANQHHHLPFGPRADMVRVQVENTDETELEAEPKQFDEDPEQEIAFEDHLARDGVFPKRGVNG